MQPQSRLGNALIAIPYTVTSTGDAMILYHGAEFNQKESNSLLRHLGSMLAAARRLESKYAAQAKRLYAGGDNFFIIEHDGRQRQETLAQTLSGFCAYMNNCRIVSADVNVRSPLRLHDCWDDDPIASGGLKIFSSTTGLSAQQHDKLRALFSPFVDVIYPDHVHALLPREIIKRIYKSASSNALFKDLLAGRKNRLIAIGQYDVESMYHEAVWIDLTLRLRLWAIENGFDSFVYENKLEGAGEDSYVILAASQMSKLNYEYTFNKEKYLNTVLPVFQQFLQETLVDHSQRFDSASIVQHIFWAGLDPLLFWT
jgi:hypothetical protein